jgi:hypothetical protein
MSTTPIPPDAALFAALAKAQSLAKLVEKDARNAFHKYNYASAEALIAEAKAALAECGLAVIPSELMIQEPRAAESECGAKAVLIAEWFVVHEAGGRHVIHCQWPVIPEKGRPLDKALAAARTASLGYLLRDLLQLPRVEEGTDLDHDSRDHGRGAAPMSRADGPAVSPRQSPPAASYDDEEAARIRDLKLGVKAQLARLGIADADAAATIRRYSGGTMPSTVFAWEDVLAVLKEASPA